VPRGRVLWGARTVDVVRRAGLLAVVGVTLLACGVGGSGESVAAPGAMAVPVPASVHARSWIVADVDTGDVLAAKDPHLRLRPASTLKTLAAVVLLPVLPSATPITVTAQEIALTSQRDGVTTRVGLEPGRRYPAGDLFRSMLAVSANDAAEALAGAAPGGRAGTLASMNAEARHLGALDTYAATPDGLDATGQLTSAYDLALIARAAISVPGFVAYDDAPSVTLASARGPIGGVSHNRLLRSFPGAFAGKDGYTSRAGQVWWGAAQRGSHRLVVVVMDAGARPVTQQEDLLTWGFRADGTVPPIDHLSTPAALTAPTASAQALASGTAPVARHGARAQVAVAHPRNGHTLILGLLTALGIGLLGRRTHQQKQAHRG
jgi:D-alanyl-D-alanine carboxypeptidase (penicillin-binding protein 5/6)